MAQFPVRILMKRELLSVDSKTLPLTPKDMFFSMLSSECKIDFIMKKMLKVEKVNKWGCTSVRSWGNEGGKR